jgi:hypothetical protein
LAEGKFVEICSSLLQKPDALENNTKNRKGIDRSKLPKISIDGINDIEDTIEINFQKKIKNCI